MARAGGGKLDPKGIAGRGRREHLGSVVLTTLIVDGKQVRSGEGAEIVGVDQFGNQMDGSFCAAKDSIYDVLSLGNYNFMGEGIGNRLGRAPTLRFYLRRPNGLIGREITLDWKP